jgi:hypothetical protein
MTEREKIIGELNQLGSRYGQRVIEIIGFFDDDDSVFDEAWIEVITKGWSLNRLRRSRDEMERKVAALERHLQMAVQRN